MLRLPAVGEAKKPPARVWDLPKRVGAESAPLGVPRFSWLRMLVPQADRVRLYLREVFWLPAPGPPWLPVRPPPRPRPPPPPPREPPPPPPPLPPPRPDLPLPSEMGPMPMTLLTRRLRDTLSGPV